MKSEEGHYFQSWHCHLQNKKGLRLSLLALIFIEKLRRKKKGGKIFVEKK
jgi:hypothetical protein